MLKIPKFLYLVRNMSYYLIIIYIIYIYIVIKLKIASNFKLNIKIMPSYYYLLSYY